jgi:hypothetical protein
MTDYVKISKLIRRIRDCANPVRHHNFEIYAALWPDTYEVRSVEMRYPDLGPVNERHLYMNGDLIFPGRDMNPLEYVESALDLIDRRDFALHYLSRHRVFDGVNHCASIARDWHQVAAAYHPRPAMALTLGLLHAELKVQS